MKIQTLSIIVFLLILNTSAASQNKWLDIYIDTILTNDLVIKHGETYNEKYRVTDSIYIAYKGQELISQCGDLYTLSDSQYYSDKGEITLEDINKSGNKNLVLRYHSGGNHCCHFMKIWELKPNKADLIFNNNHQDGSNFYKKLDKGKDQGKFEIIYHEAIKDHLIEYKDDSWSYWHMSYSVSPSFKVKLRWSGEKYVYYNSENILKDSIYWKDGYDYNLVPSSYLLSKCDTIVADILNLEAWKTPINQEEVSFKYNGIAPYVGRIIDFLENGYTQEAHNFVHEAWGGSIDDKLIFIIDFIYQLYQCDDIGYLQMKNPDLEKYFPR